MHPSTWLGFRLAGAARGKPGYLLHGLAAGAAILAASAWFTPTARAAEPPECLSPNPADWPAPAKPYFMIAFDTSGSMMNPVPFVGNPVLPSCGAAYGATRVGHGRCAIKNTIDAYAGQANFGLATYATQLSGCGPGACTQPPPPASTWQTCTVSLLPGDAPGTNCNGGCGPEPSAVAFSANRAGGNIVVPMLQDLNPAPATNVPDLLAWVDNDCTDSRELYASGCTPLNGILRDMFRYYSGSWTFPSSVVPNPNIPVLSPLTSVANGEKACRSVNVILVTDGDETCDVNPTDAVDAAKKLFAGFNKDGIAWKVRTYVINFSGGVKANTDQIARAGTGDLTPATKDAGDPVGVTDSFQAENEVDISLALSQIIGSSIQTETCDNKDNNCNGCTDEGFSHYCNDQVAPLAAKCCVWANAAARQTCLNTYNGTITPQNPQGNLAKLPCTTPAQFLDPTTWLCFDPKETCDTKDNNCNGVTDEGTLTCGNPAHCPAVEVCNGQDDNCNGTIDEGCPVCLVAPSAETCDGCDNDCDGIADNGVAQVACGLVGPNEPPNCAGVQTCKAQQVVAQPGACKAGGGFNPCTAVPQAETCDGLDNNCNGIVDDGVAALACVPAGTPGNLVYFGENGNVTSQCHKGSKSCTNGAFGVCIGFVGPTPEICDGIDNDCDGVVDDSPVGIGQMCGINQLPCTPGTTACVNGALVCNGGVAPKPETCNGLDDNCNGLIDDPPLADAPAAGQNGCWDLPGNCCQFPPAPAQAKLVWCPPAGGQCGNSGSLSVPCHAGTLSCSGATGWICVGPSDPSGETCDGLDNDCNGSIDDGNLPMVGAACGSDTGECQSGTLVCNVGVLSCMGAVTPVQETCDNKDNDCDGTIDNNVAPMGPCIETYDMVAFPGDRSSAPCKPGVLLCDGMGNFKCQGGVAPHAELCDGQDNDCDGQKDEIGVAPDGISGTADPNDLTHVLGQACGGMGQCAGGTWECLNGQVSCGGEQKPVPETCDCSDNDCDGVTDNQNAPGLPPICGVGSKDCVKSADACFCSPKCNLQNEFPCPPGQTCKPVTSSQTGESLGTYCIPDSCNDCAHQTVKDGNDKVVCAPADTPPDANCYEPPVCVCRGQTGCNTPCSGKGACPMGRICTDYGPKAGQCVPNNCYNLPCNGCGMACNGGGCVQNPCTAVTCPLTKVCKPTEDFQGHTCVDSCVGVSCPGGKACVDGACVPTCDPACPMGKVCDTAQSPPVCVNDKCNPDPCTDGSFCNPASGQCTNYPCSGVLCPAGQSCDERNGQCVLIDQGTGGGGGSTTGTTTSTSTSGATTGSTSSSSGGGEGGTRGVFGLATGGGGCSCEVGPQGSRLADVRWLLVGLAIALGRQRRRTRRAQRGEVAR
jgi:hypothetical protein